MDFGEILLNMNTTANGNGDDNDDDTLEINNYNVSKL